MKFQVAGAQNLKHCDAGALRAGTASGAAPDTAGTARHLSDHLGGRLASMRCPGIDFSTSGAVPGLPCHQRGVGVSHPSCADRRGKRAILPPGRRLICASMC